MSEKTFEQAVESLQPIDGANPPDTSAGCHIRLVDIGIFSFVGSKIALYSIKKPFN
jgi:hypothetical protein